MQKRLFIINGIILFQLILFFRLAKAQTRWREQEGALSDVPIVITSEKVDLDNQKREALYSGGVMAVKGEMILTADSLNVFFNKTGQGIEFIQAKGQVKIWWNDKYAEAEECKYDNKSAAIILSGSAKTWQGDNMLKGEKITYDLNNDKVLVEGDVETIFRLNSELLEKTKH